MENLCKIYNSLYGLKTISLRYFNVYGDRQPTKGQYAPVIGLFLKQNKKNQNYLLYQKYKLYLQLKKS